MSQRSPHSIYVSNIKTIRHNNNNPRNILYLGLLKGTGWINILGFLHFKAKHHVNSFKLSVQKRGSKIKRNNLLRNEQFRLHWRRPLLTKDEDILPELFLLHMYPFPKIKATRWHDRPAKANIVGFL